MPIKTEEGKTPNGHLCMRALVSGHVSLADAEAMSAQLRKGQHFHGVRVLCLVEKSTEYSAEARKHFGSMHGNYLRMATVVTSAFLRASINFMTRLFGHREDFRLFNTEAEAQAWLDQS